MNITLEKLKQPGDLASLENMINSRLNEAANFKISLENIDYINLANFNALVRLYMKLTRTGKDILYINCYSEKIKTFITKTQFHHVFST